MIVMKASMQLRATGALCTLQSSQCLLSKATAGHDMSLARIAKEQNGLFQVGPSP